MAKTTVETPGKVNLVLDVLARREDGYHDISSLMMAVGLYDRLTIEDSEVGAIELACDAPDVPTDESNLVWQAVRKLRDRVGTRRGCRIKLEKRIPSGGGMGGGSGNAAGILVGLNHHWKLGVADSELAEIGSTIGADVPFFLATPSAIVTGIGDCVRRAEMSWRGWVLLVMCQVHVSTPEVYAGCTPAGQDTDRGETADLLRCCEAAELQPLLRNDLERAVYDVAPEVRRVRDALVAMGATTARVSGAGSVLFELFDRKGEAQEFAHRIQAELPEVGVSVVEAPVRMKVSEGDYSHGNQRCSGEVDRQR